MNNSPSALAPSQIRAGRALLGWNQQQLADAAQVGIGTIRDYENERRGSVIGALAQIQAALTLAGVIFIPADDQSGSGVRLIGNLPNVLRWPTRREESGAIRIRIEWSGGRYDVLLPQETLEDLGEIDPDANPGDSEYLDIVEDHRLPILKAAATKIAAKEHTPDRRVYLTEAEVRFSLTTGVQGHR